MGAREDILAVIRRLGQETFSVADVLAEMAPSSYAESTIRTHITSRMCADAPDNHGATYADLERVARGRYRVRQR